MAADSVDPGAGSYPRARWRLLVDAEADGATNMAIDEAILEAVVAGDSLPTIRFYQWAPPCLSLGRSQPLADVDLAACRVGGIGVVRRPSGGRAILHTDELTYSVALPAADPRAGDGVVDGYRRLSAGLLAGLERLGAMAVQAAGRRPEQASLTAICFETPSQYEITVGDRKLVGSAQWRARGGVLQHGTLPLYGDLGRIVHYLALDEAARELECTCLRSRALTLHEALRRPVPFLEAATCLAAGFGQVLNLELEQCSLTPRERQTAVALHQARYASLDWTERVR
ncbi:MAG TPA: lipoate--protein ligase family protein [Anaerolineae bacterium]|nr:lipoate--protein ligase family protein [Anaerolineae bacterium]